MDGITGGWPICRAILLRPRVYHFYLPALRMILIIVKSTNRFERVFIRQLPDSEKFLSFDRLWEIYEDETPMPRNENFYEYKPVEPSMIPALKKLSLEAYQSCGGKGYTRIDIRQILQPGNYTCWKSMPNADSARRGLYLLRSGPS